MYVPQSGMENEIAKIWLHTINQWWSKYSSCAHACICNLYTLWQPYAAASKFMLNGYTLSIQKSAKSATFCSTWDKSTCTSIVLSKLHIRRNCAKRAKNSHGLTGPWLPRHERVLWDTPWALYPVYTTILPKNYRLYIYILIQCLYVTHQTSISVTAISISVNSVYTLRINPHNGFNVEWIHTTIQISGKPSTHT